MPNRIKLPIGDLQIGMYVCDLDRPWLETPFLMQGFCIDTDNDIGRLKQYCTFVYIDPALSQQNLSNFLPHTVRMPTERQSVDTIFKGRRLHHYDDKTTWHEEFPNANLALQDLCGSIQNLLDYKSKKFSLDIPKLKQAVDPIIESITRNPDACLWLARIKRENNYSYQHALGCSIWAVALGRQLGLGKGDLRSLAIGGLLLDIGKLWIDKNLLQANRRLKDIEFDQIKKHVEIGINVLQSNDKVNQDIIDMVAFHHERHNGKGYPNRLSGDDIPVFARIAAIVDCYDAITSNRSYAKAISPSSAIKELHTWKNVDFQGELVEEFIQAIGIYPAGTLVELSSGEVAIVVSEYRTRRLRPKVMLLLDANKNLVKHSTLIDLKNMASTNHNKNLDIVNSLEPGAYGIDMAAIHL